MSDFSTLGRRLRNAILRHNRGLTRLYMGGLVTLLLVLGAPPARGAVLGAMQRVVDAWDDRWTRRVEQGELLLAAGLPERAAAYLEVLDAEFPARHVKHRRDKERVRVLRALAASYSTLGEKRETLETLRRLVAFDPNDYLSHYGLAMAALQFNEEDEARLHFVEALRIDPGHLASLRAYTGTYFDAGDYAMVVEIFNQYLSSFAMHEFELQLGDTAMVFLVPVDGRTHDIVLRVPRPAGWQGHLALSTRGLWAELAAVRLVPPLSAGRLPADDVVLEPAGGLPWIADGSGDPAAGGGRDPALRLEVAARDGVESITLRIRLPKPVDPVLWSMVEKSYRNRLDHDGLARALALTHVLPSVEAERFIVRPE